MSAPELAAKIGKNVATVYRYENGDIHTVPSDTVAPLANALQVSTAVLLTGAEITVPEPDGPEPDEPEAFAKTDFTGVAPIHQRIFYRREWLRMSRSELALAAGLPDIESVEAIENGETELRPELVRRLTIALRCTAGELIGCTDTEWSIFCHIWKLLSE